MKITNISCTQFAGVRDRSVALTDGINVIYGKNESGKSTSQPDRPHPLSGCEA